MPEPALPGYEYVGEIAKQLIDHSLDMPLYDQPIGELTSRMVTTALFNPLNLERDCALTGRLYPKEVSQRLSEKERLGYTAPWFVQSMFLVGGDLAGLRVKALFLTPKAVTDLVSPKILGLQMVEMVIEHQASELARSEEKQINVENKEGKPCIFLTAKLQSNIKRVGDSYHVVIRLENVSWVRSPDKAVKQIAYRSAFAFFAPLIVVEVLGNVNRIVTQDDPYADRKELMNCNCFTRRSKQSSKTVLASPLIVLDRPVKRPKLADNEIAGYDQDIEMVLRITARREGVERLFKHQLDSLRIFSDLISSGAGTKCIVSVVPTAFGKTLTACTMALYSALKFRGPGTKALMLFPTRVLTIQQLTALAKYIYDINAGGGRRITLGLYIGKGNGEGSAYAPEHLITECPACGKGPLTQFESDGRIYPRCPSCERVLDYILLDDRDTQLFCPDIVVATPDKLAYELQRDVASHVLVGAPMYVCGACGRANPRLGGQQACAGCGSSLEGVGVSRSDIRFVFFDEFTLLSGMASSRLSHFMKLLRRLKQVYVLRDDIIFFLACATASNPVEFASKFAGVSNEDVVLLRAEDYFQEERRPWQRLIVLYPWDLSTNGSVSWGCLAIAGALESISGSQREAYGKQLVYVQRRDEGHNLYDYIQRLGEEVGVRVGDVFFLHGDLKADELARGKSEAQRAERAILIGTSTLGWGVHMPWLNVAHMWGAPNSTGEFFQVIGRVGREVVRHRENPALVVLHLHPGNPRDVWLYDNFISWFNDPSFEPEVIDPHNVAVVRSTVPACIVSLLISKIYTKYYSDYDPRSSIRRSKAIMQCLRNDIMQIAEEAARWIFLIGLDGAGGASERLKRSFLDSIYEYIQALQARVGFRNLTEAFPETAEFALRGRESSVSYTVSGPLLAMLNRLKGLAAEGAEDLADLEAGGNNE